MGFKWITLESSSSSGDGNTSSKWIILESSARVRRPRVSEKNKTEDEVRPQHSLESFVEAHGGSRVNDERRLLRQHLSVGVADAKTGFRHVAGNRHDLLAEVGVHLGAFRKHLQTRNASGVISRGAVI